MENLLPLLFCLWFHTIFSSSYQDFCALEHKDHLIETNSGDYRNVDRLVEALCLF